jgi:hypothetical protein
MAPDPTPHVPGNMTVSFLFGWQGIVLALVILIVSGVAFLLVSASRSTRETRAEWQGYLEARSRAATGRVPQSELSRGGGPAWAPDLAVPPRRPGAGEPPPRR